MLPYFSDTPFSGHLAERAPNLSKGDSSSLSCKFDSSWRFNEKKAICMVGENGSYAIAKGFRCVTSWQRTEIGSQCDSQIWKTDMMLLPLLLFYARMGLIRPRVEMFGKEFRWGKSLGTQHRRRVIKAHRQLNSRSFAGSYATKETLDLNHVHPISSQEILVKRGIICDFFTLN